MTRRWSASYIRRLQSRLGPLAVQCLCSERWLKLGAKAERLPDGDFLAVDLMKLRDPDTRKLGASKKLASLTISRQDLERALNHVQWPEAEQKKAADENIDEQVFGIVSQTMTQLSLLSSDPYFRDAIMKATLRELSHRFVDLGVLPDDVADHLGIMADVMRAHD